MKIKNTSQRRDKILKKLAEFGSVSVIELSKNFEVSVVTIRNDLSFLEKQGTLIRSHGGAISETNLIKEHSVEIKGGLNADEKCRIAEKAAELINDNDTIILDSGTTTELIAKYIAKDKHITAMTNGLNVAVSLSKSENVALLMSGGKMRLNSLSFYGEQAENNLKLYHFDKLFLGVDGFDLSIGITTHSESEARLNRVMSSVVNEIIVVTDSSKFKKISLYKIFQADNINTLITDSGIPQEYHETLVKMGINVIIA